MAYIHELVLFLTAVVLVSGVTVNLTVDDSSRPNSPDFYRGETLQVECDYDLDGAPENTLPTLTGIGIQVVEPGSVGKYLGCSVKTTPSSVSGEQSDAARFPFAEGPGDEACTALRQELGDNERASFTFSLDLQVAAEYRCALWTIFTVQYLSEPVNVTDLLTIPDSPVTATVTDGQAVYLDDDIVFTCSSSGGVPEANWSYTMNGEEFTTDENKISPTGSTDLIYLRCNDLSHPNWGGASSLISYEATIHVYYLTSSMQVKNQTLNPSVSYKLSCDTTHNLVPGDKLEYTWFLDGEELFDEMEKVIDVTQRNGTMSEVYLCTVAAKDSNLKDVYTTYNINWDDTASTPAKPTEPPKIPKESDVESEPVSNSNLVTIIIIVVVVVLVIIGLIIIVVVIIKRKANNGSSEIAKKADNRVTGEDTEKGKTDGTTEEPEKQVLLNEEGKGDANPTEEKEVKA